MKLTKVMTLVAAAALPAATLLAAPSAQAVDTQPPLTGPVVYQPNFEGFLWQWGKRATERIGKPPFGGTLGEGRLVPGPTTSSSFSAYECKSTKKRGKVIKRSGINGNVRLTPPGERQATYRAVLAATSWSASTPEDGVIRVDGGFKPGKYTCTVKSGKQVWKTRISVPALKVPAVKKRFPESIATVPGDVSEGNVGGPRQFLYSGTGGLATPWAPLAYEEMNINVDVALRQASKVAKIWYKFDYLTAGQAAAVPGLPDSSSGWVQLCSNRDSCGGGYLTFPVAQPPYDPSRTEGMVWVVAQLADGRYTSVTFQRQYVYGPSDDSGQEQPTPTPTPTPTPNPEPGSPETVGDLSLTVTRTHTGEGFHWFTAKVSPGADAPVGARYYLESFWGTEENALHPSAVWQADTECLPGGPTWPGWSTGCSPRFLGNLQSEFGISEGATNIWMRVVFVVGESAVARTAPVAVPLP